MSQLPTNSYRQLRRSCSELQIQCAESWPGEFTEQMLFLDGKPNNNKGVLTAVKDVSTNIELKIPNTLPPQCLQLLVEFSTICNGYCVQVSWYMTPWIAGQRVRLSSSI